MKRWARKTAIWAGSITLIIVGVGGTLIFTFLHLFYPTVAAAQFPQPLSLAAGQRQDLKYFRQYLKYNHAYSAAAQAEVERMLHEYDTSAVEMSPAKFELAVAKMVALSDNGHSAVYEGAFRRRHNKLPCMLYHFSDGYYILKARTPCQQLLGAKLVTIDGHPVAEIADRMFEYVRGPRNHYDQFVTPFYLESPELLNAVGLTALADREMLHVVLPDGSEHDYSIQADPPDPDWKWWVFSDAYLSNEQTPSLSADWKSYLNADAKIPVAIADYENPFHAADWTGVYYVGFRSNQNEGEHAIGPFVSKVEKAIAASRPHVVILDLRFDQGGDCTTTASFVSHITQLTPSIQKVFVITSAWTFSAGEISAALAKEHGGEKVTIIGEGVGDRLRLWADGGNMTLPNSTIIMHYATGLHDYSKPCWRESGCFWTMYFFPMHLNTLEPEVTVPYTFADYRALRDPVVDYILHASSNKGPT